MELKRGESLWQATGEHSHLSGPLTESINADALIVGSGVTGALAAQTLAAEGLRAIVIDRRKLASGSTPASTALLLSEIDVALTELSRMIGAESATRAYRASNRAMKGLSDLLQSLGIECGLKKRPALYLASSPSDCDRFQTEAAARTTIGLRAAYQTGASVASRWGITRPGAILSSGYEADPLALAIGLHRRAVDCGARLFELTEADLNSACGGPPFRISTNGGHTIRADWVVIATGYEAPEQFSAVAQRTRLRCTYAMASQPIEGLAWPEPVLLWEHAEPYLYARPGPNNRIIVGGEDDDHTTMEEADRRLSGKVNQLRRKIADLCSAPEVSPDFAWAGVFAETPDGLPLIGEHPRWPHVLFALGYGGNGITFSHLAAELIRDRILQRRNEEAELFAVDRDFPGSPG